MSLSSHLGLRMGLKLGLGSGKGVQGSGLGIRALEAKGQRERLGAKESAETSLLFLV